MKNTALLITMILSYCSMAQVAITTATPVLEDPPDTTALNPPPPPSGDTIIPKLVFWIHGLAGNEDSWGRVNDATYDQNVYPVSGYPERNMEGCIDSYSEYESYPILNLANYYIDKVEKWRKLWSRDTLDPMKNIAIAHSQGGLVSRAMRHRYLNNVRPVQFNALATFGTPHGGANIINTTRPDTGDVQAWIEEGCVALTTAELVELKNSKWWLNMLVSTSAAQDFAETACEFLEGTVLPIVVDAIRKPVGADYAVGAPSLDILEATAQQDTMPVVTFYGVEEEPVFWRVIHSMTYTTDTSLSGQILFNDPFGLNDDDELPDYINDLAAKYKAWGDFYQNLYDNFYWRSGFVGLFHGREDAKMDAEANYNARNWLLGANMRWKRFIGARRDSSSQNGYLCYCNNAVIPNWVSDPSYCVDESENPCDAVPHMSHIVIEEPSDGVVPVSSQVAYPGARAWPMEKTNHMQARNCEQTKLRLNELFDGKRGFEFKLYKK